MLGKRELMIELYLSFSITSEDFFLHPSRGSTVVINQNIGKLLFPGCFINMVLGDFGQSLRMFDWKEKIFLTSLSPSSLLGHALNPVKRLFFI
jgi:hypothetical protein